MPQRDVHLDVLIEDLTADLDRANLLLNEARQDGLEAAFRAGEAFERVLLRSDLMVTRLPVAEQRLAVPRCRARNGIGYVRLLQAKAARKTGKNPAEVLQLYAAALEDFEQARKGQPEPAFQLRCAGHAAYTQFLMGDRRAARDALLSVLREGGDEALDRRLKATETWVTPEDASCRDLIWDVWDEVEAAKLARA